MVDPSPSSHTQPSDNRLRRLIVAIILGHAALLALFVWLRMAEGDEGFYLSAARAILHGKGIYTEFFHPQMPLVPWLFSGLSGYGWTSYFLLRGAAALAGVLTLIAIIRIVVVETRSRGAAVAAGLMYGLSGMVLAWHSVYKLYAFTDLLMVASFLAWCVYHRTRRAWLLVPLGLCLSAAACSRATLVVLIPLYLVSILAISRPKSPGAVLLFILSLLPPAIPVVVKYLESPAHFLFNNVTYHLYREVDRSLGYMLENKLSVIAKLLADPHLFVIVALVLVGIRLHHRRHQLRSPRDFIATPAGMALSQLILVAGVYFLAHVTMRQYAIQYLGFAVLFVALSWEQLTDRWRRQSQLVRRLTIVAAAACWLVSLAAYTAVYIFGVREQVPPESTRLSELRKITNEVRRLTAPTDTIMSEWAIYPVLAQRPIIPMTEFRISGFPFPLSHNEYLDFHLGDYEYVRNQLDRRTARVMVTAGGVAPYFEAELKRGYRKVMSSEGITVWERKPSDRPPG